MLPHWHIILRWAGILFPLVVTLLPVPRSGSGPRKQLVLWLHSSPFPLHQAMCWGTQITQSHFLYHLSLQPAEISCPPLQLSFTASIHPPPLLLPPVLPFCLPSFLPLIHHPSIHLPLQICLPIFLMYPTFQSSGRGSVTYKSILKKRNFSLKEGSPGSLTLQGLTHQRKQTTLI